MWYVSQVGDWLSTIARDQMNDVSAWPQLYEVNKERIGPDPNILVPGTKLWIPTSEAPYPPGENQVVTAPTSETSKSFTFPKMSANTIMIAAGAGMGIIALMQIAKKKQNAV